MLSDSQIKSLKIEDGKRHADRDGLVLELRPSKKKLNKVFIFRFQWNKKSQTITIGNYPSVSLADARITALAYRDLVNNEIDPRSKNADAGLARITFQVVAEQWFQKYKGAWKEVALNRHSKSLTRDIYPFIADKPIDDITKSDLLGIIHRHEALEHHSVASQALWKKRACA